MKKNNYYEITDKFNFKEYPIRFIQKVGSFFNVYFPFENVEKNLNDNVQYRELTLTNTHLERMGFLNKNGKFVSVHGYYLFPQFAIGGSSNQDLSLLFFGYYLIEEENSAKYWLDYKVQTEKYIKNEISLENIKDLFPGIYNLNSLIAKFEQLGVSFDNYDLVVSGFEK